MSLATRCTACGTVFRVVQDQLRVSGGWVRCGRCSAVFNAIESLVDLELDRPAEGAQPSVHGDRVMQDLARVSGQPAAPEPEPPAPEPAAAAPDPMPPQGTAEQTVPAVAADPPEPAPAAVISAPAAPARLAPRFLRQAANAERWRRPQVRAGLALAALIAAAGLAWQVAWVHHDTLAARWPAMRPLLARVCAPPGCSIEPPRRIDSLAVESSGLTRAGPPGAYRLAVVLRNRDSLALRPPALDLVLTDAQGNALARRVLQPVEMGASQPAIPGGGELALAATLRTRDPAVVGYTIELFYP
jgi:predicted Zn finger-like uncharacterized protein